MSLEPSNSSVTRLGFVSRRPVAVDGAASVVEVVGGQDSSIIHAVVTAIEKQFRDAIVALDSGSLFEASSEVIRDLPEDRDLAFDDLVLATGRHVRANSLDEPVPSSIIEHPFPKHPGLVEVLGIDGGQKGARVTEEVAAVNLVQVDRTLAELDRIDRRKVIRSTALVEKGHLSIPLEVSHAVGTYGLIDRQLLVVCPDPRTPIIRDSMRRRCRRYIPVPVCIRVREEPRLEDRIRGRFNARRHVRGIVGDLFDLREVVLRVGIQGHDTNLAEGEILLTPSVRKVISEG